MITTPPYLQPGDLIGIVCPAGYMAKEKAAECIRVLEEEWGYRVRIGKTLGGASETYFSGTAEERLADLQEMMDDPEVKAILCGRGGYGMTHLVDQLNFKKFRKQPKWIVGYSDITLLHTHLYSNYYISSLHAPMAGAFNEAGYVNRYVQSLRQALEGKWARYHAEAHELNRPGEAVAELVGGNLALLAHGIGTDSELKTRGRILFIEDIGEYLYNIDRMMYQLKRAGKLKNLAGLIIGGFSDMKDTERPFGADVYTIIDNIVKEYDYPVCYDFPVSHTERNYALKVGVGYKLKVTKSKVMLEE
ncbi:S66 peptidase family protein [Terrimonas ferruginea]|uniref:S66 peptidase family protein n=1 Tax=Terrimonas ferruginea TaxID=249 RepID=UPI00042A3A3A|nr:LD-carboxypeptidase [Terrimonas ferruginea]